MCCLDIHSQNPSFHPSREHPLARFSVWRSLLPNIESAKKNMRKSRAATVRNRAQRSALRTAVKKARAENATPEDRALAVKLLDRSARKGLIHGNSAARQKSRLAKAG
jgi:small subunit ribosomal protein S20